LKETGSIGFITSDKWLDTKYGVQLSQFFLENFVLKCIIKFDKQVFSDPLIGTAITILRKESSKTKRDSNHVRLLRLKKSMGIDEVIALLEEPKSPDAVYESPKFRLVIKTQEELRGEWKWLRYLYAPDIYFDIMKSGKLVKLSEVATPTRGRVTGANDFFYMTKEDAKARGLEAKYLKPILKAIAQAEFIDLRKEDTEWYCLDLHHTVSGILKEIEGREALRTRDSPLVDLVKLEIKKQSKSLYDHIEWGEEQGFHKTPTCRARKIWFDAGELLRPQLIFPDVYWKRTLVPFNSDGIAVDKQLYGLVPVNEGSEEAFLVGGIMNSSINSLMREMYGRTVGGEGLNRNQVMVWEANDMPVVEPNAIDERARKRIVDAFKLLVLGGRTASPELSTKMQRDLNLAVMDAIGLESRTQELEEEVQNLIETRVKGGGESKDTMIEAQQEEHAVKVTPLRGARLIGKESSLDRFVDSSES
jgi:hypothetical protein